ncbi:hypothetical protein [Shewanella glacialimarina]|uniref:hypothetical protein n=1 Tax=Shewanella glacialimarina TaxID=2590884 RepID=UPI001CF92091|nr:hypothetical protein [Shewanella glacialimarina]UCX05201.1 hypothetical protein FJ709_12255 [Shewanella glacialimarina]
MQPRSLGLINGLLTLSVWSIVGLILATNWFGVIPIFLFILIPTSALVSWRSTSLAPQLIKGSATLKLYAIDGFKWGVISGVVFWTWSISTQVLAAGDPLMGASFTQVVEYIFTISLPFTLLFGVSGLIHSIVFYYLNRWLVVNYS